MRSFKGIVRRSSILLLALALVLGILVGCREKEPPHTDEHTAGLTFALNKAGTAYRVTGMGTATATNVVIPAIYQGLPVEEIGDNAFAAQTALVDVDIPVTVKRIGNRAFRDCINLQAWNVKQGSQLESIGYAAFKGCRGITAISISEDNAIRSIGESAFSDCTSIVGFSIPSLLTTIEPYTFKGCSSLARISIPQRITQIGEYAFEGCSGLLDVIFANDASLTKLSAWAFFGCERLAIIDLPESLTEIGASVFRKCNTLESVTIPAATTTIGSYAFSYCKNLSTLQVAQGNPMFYAVDNCIVNRATRSVVVGCKTSKIPADDSVVSVGAYAFAGCSGLKSLKIPEGIVSIGGYAFVDCTNLKTVDLPVSVTLVEGGAFSGCDRTTHIYYHGDVSEVWQTIDIKNGNDGLTRNDGTAAGTVNWYTYSATRPTTVGMFWRYTSSGTPKVWT